MNNPQTRREPTALGIRPEVIDDVLAMTIVLVALFIFLSLASHAPTGNLTGAAGERIYDLLTFIFGKYVAYVPVTVLMAWGISFWRGRRWRHVPARVAGGFFAIVCLCALLAIPYANRDFSREEGFRVGGALGNFLVHRECLDLRNLLGLGGSYLVFTTLLLVSLMVAADVHLRSLLGRLASVIAALDLRQWARSPLAAPWSARGSDESDPEEAEDVAASLLEAQEDEPLQRVDDSPKRPDSRSKSLSTVWARLAQRSEPPTVPSQSEIPASSKPAALQELRADVEQAMRTIFSDATRRPAAPASADALSPKSDDTTREVAAGPDQPQAPPDDLLSPVRDSQESATPRSFPETYEPPPLDIFQPPPKAMTAVNENEMAEFIAILERTLSEFDISARVVNFEQGPTVSRIEVEPAAGVKISRITALEADIARAMRAESIRIIAPIPGRGTVGFEVPNKRRRLVYLRQVIESPKFRDHESPLAIALGATTTGEPYVGDLAAMPHLLIAGATGSGKSVCLNSIICSILFRMPPDKVKFIMIDPKRVELSVYRDIPHLLAPVVTDVRNAAAALKWAVSEMELRYSQLEKLAVRNITAYNSIVQSAEPSPKLLGRHLDSMPHIVIVIDELADLMHVARNEVEDPIMRLAQKSRAVGMHLIVATQRPSVNVITGVIKANFPCRIAFKVAQKHDSRTILDSNGAEALLGRGDMLYSPGGGQKPIRLQGCFASDDEVEKLASYLRAQKAPEYWKDTFVEEEEETGEANTEVREFAQARCDTEELATEGRDSERASFATKATQTLRVADDAEPINDTLVREATRVVLTHRLASTSLLQRKLRIGFARAGRLMDILEDMGVVGPSCGPKPREILVDPDEYLRQMDEEEKDF